MRRLPAETALQLVANDATGLLLQEVDGVKDTFLAEFVLRPLQTKQSSELTMALCKAAAAVSKSLSVHDVFDEYVTESLTHLDAIMAMPSWAVMLTDEHFVADVTLAVRNVARSCFLPLAMKIMAGHVTSQLVVATVLEYLVIMLTKERHVRYIEVLIPYWRGLVDAIQAHHKTHYSITCNALQLWCVMACSSECGRIPDPVLMAIMKASRAHHKDLVMMCMWALGREVADAAGQRHVWLPGVPLANVRAVFHFAEASVPWRTEAWAAKALLGLYGQVVEMYWLEARDVMDPAQICLLGVVASKAEEAPEVPEVPGGWGEGESFSDAVMWLSGPWRDGERSAGRFQSVSQWAWTRSPDVCVQVVFPKDRAIATVSVLESLQYLKTLKTGTVGGHVTRCILKVLADEMHRRSRDVVALGFDLLQTVPGEAFLVEDEAMAALHALRIHLYDPEVTMAGLGVMKIMADLGTAVSTTAVFADIVLSVQTSCPSRYGLRFHAILAMCKHFGK
jgi:hypothetical protein